MPYRTPALLLMGLAGAVAVAGLVLIGIDVYAARERGPRWKRRLLGAGLAVLGLLGIGYAARPRPTCYDMPSMPFTAPSLQRLEMQTSLLYLLTAEGRLEPEAARKALAAAENALAEASAPEMLKGLSPEERSRAEGFLRHAQAQIDQLKARLDANPPVPAKPTANLEESADWKVITDAWDFAMPFARSGRSTTAQRDQIDAKLAAARLAAARLVGTGRLSAKEAELLDSEAEKAAKDILLNPPTDPMFKCYDRGYIAPKRLSLASIKGRLPAIEALIKDGKVHPAAIGKVLEAIEADLATLADEKRRAELGDQTPKAEADKLRETTKAEIEKLKKLLEDGK